MVTVPALSLVVNLVDRTLFYEHHGIAQTCSSNGRCAGHFKVIRDNRNENRQIEIAIEAPREVEVALVRKRRPGRRRNVP